MDKKLKFFYFFFFVGFLSFGQLVNDLTTDKNRFTIPFTLVNNLIIVPVVINETPLNMVLDTGSPYTLIVDYMGIDELVLSKGKKIVIGGLGHGYDIEAYDSRFNQLKIGKATKQDTHLIILLNSPMKLSQSLGMPVHGITGFDILKDFVVEINYRSKKIKFYKHNYFYQRKKRKIRRHQPTPLLFHERKPYIQASIKSGEHKADTANLLVDTGGWDAIWWFKNSNPKIPLPSLHYKDTLGYGINGPITGFLSKTDFIKIGNFKFERPTTSFPDSVSLASAVSFENRNGSIGGEIIKRFHVIFDYKNKLMYLKPNLNYNNEFHYNMSGLKLEKTFEFLPFLEIVAVRQNSPAFHSGFKKGDLITSINGEDLKEGDLGKINNLFKSNPGKKITASLLRNGQKLSKSFYLVDPF